MHFREGDAGKYRKVLRTWGTGENRKEARAVPNIFSFFFFLDLEGAQMMTDSSKVFRGPVIYE